jgi:hypothetical protein
MGLWHGMTAALVLGLQRLHMCDLRGAVAVSIPLPAGLALEAARWEQTPPIVRHVGVHFPAVIPHQAMWIAALDARVSQNSRNSDRPPSSSTTTRTPGAKPGHPGHGPALLGPRERIEVTPDTCAYGQQACPATTPSSTHQVIERPEIQMSVTHVVWPEAPGPRCGRLIKAELPAEYR